MPLEFAYHAPQPLPVELPGLTPDQFRGESLDALRRFPAQIGNTTTPVGDLFAVSGDPSDTDWRFSGDLSGVHWIGAGMTEGSLQVDGPVGRHAGSGMQGGRLHITGDAGDWLGAEMQGGQIEVTGHAADALGAAYAGSPRGMRGGQIVVHGAAGDRVGHALRRGMIVIGGACGEYAGYRMLAGTILVFGDLISRNGSNARPGAEMVRGTIGLFGPQTPTLLPTYRHACRIQPQFLGLMARELSSLGFAVSTQVDLFNGDLLTGGRGEILVGR